MLVDVTAEVERRIAQGSVPTTWAAHVHSNKVQNHVSQTCLSCKLDIICLSSISSCLASECFTHLSI